MNCIATAKPGGLVECVWPVCRWDQLELSCTERIPELLTGVIIWGEQNTTARQIMLQSTALHVNLKTVTVAGTGWVWLNPACPYLAMASISKFWNAWKSRFALKERACKHYRLLAGSWFPSPHHMRATKSHQPCTACWPWNWFVNRSPAVEVWVLLEVAHSYLIYLDDLGCLSGFSIVNRRNSIVVDVAACLKKAELLSTVCTSSGFSPQCARATHTQFR